MPVQDPDDQYLRVAMMIMLSLALLAGVCATAIHWLGPVHHPMDRVVPPVASVLFAGLLSALWRRPAWVGVITRIALSLSALALIAPAWLYTVQASLSPDLRLIDTPVKRGQVHLSGCGAGGCRFAASVGRRGLGLHCTA